MSKVSNNQHVVPQDRGWGVKSSGAKRVSKSFDTQKQAIDHATQIAKNKKAEVLIHNKSGRIRERNSYGNDPHPPKG